WYEPCSG
ncbi:putative uridylate kinase, partial [Vibrio parahaemolyticus EKP-028]